MTDVFSRVERSRIMRGIRTKNTRPELQVRSAIHRMGYRFRLHRRDLPGRPDIVLARHQTVVFVHGCFWHRHRRCKRATIPQANRAFWAAKLTKNATRDLLTVKTLRRLGWRVLTVWSCQTKDPHRLEETLRKALPSD
ncbi:MAG: DNA mismatch endonuclease Vsr [Vicinamibacteria bacterium]|nr:DNA mismatch endonuclease Vsr [Vicinamibacteria bacterium]